MTNWVVAAYGRDIRGIDSPVTQAGFTVNADHSLAASVCKVAANLCALQVAGPAAPQWRPYQKGDPPKFVSQIQDRVSRALKLTGLGNAGAAQRQFRGAARKVEAFERKATAASLAGVISTDVAGQLRGIGEGLRTTLLELSGLVTNGVYSLFYVTVGPDSENPLCPGVERGLPLTSQDKDQTPDSSSFVADASGRAEFRGRVDGQLLDATQLAYFVIYHADGQTYGSLPNRGEYLTQGPNCRTSFGEDAMRQAVIYQKA